MSKERLEEIKEDIFKCNHGSTRGYSYEQLYHIALSLVRIHGDWLIKQAEQNERYREALEKIKNKISKQLEGLDAEEEMQRVVELSELMTMTIEALEGEE